MNKNRVGMKIKQIRQRNGLTQEEFGLLIDGANKGVVSKWERGISLPNNSRLAKIAEYADTDIDYLLYDISPISDSKRQEDIKRIEDIFMSAYKKYKKALSYRYGLTISSTITLIPIDQLQSTFTDQFLANKHNANHQDDTEIEEQAKKTIENAIKNYIKTMPNTNDETIKYIKEEISNLALLPTFLFKTKPEITDLQSEMTEDTFRELDRILKNTYFEISKMQELN